MKIWKLNECRALRSTINNTTYLVNGVNIAGLNVHSKCQKKWRLLNYNTLQNREFGTVFPTTINIQNINNPLPVSLAFTQLDMYLLHSGICLLVLQFCLYLGTCKGNNYSEPCRFFKSSSNTSVIICFCTSDSWLKMFIYLYFLQTWMFGNILLDVLNERNTQTWTRSMCINRLMIIVWNILHLI